MLGKLILLILISNVALDLQDKYNIKRNLELSLDLSPERGQFEDQKYDFTIAVFLILKK